MPHTAVIRVRADEIYIYIYPQMVVIIKIIFLPHILSVGPLGKERKTRGDEET